MDLWKLLDQTEKKEAKIPLKVTEKEDPERQEESMIAQKPKRKNIQEIGSDKQCQMFLWNPIRGGLNVSMMLDDMESQMAWEMRKWEWQQLF